jgi:large subunit ribosomal protein L3
LSALAREDAHEPTAVIGNEKRIATMIKGILGRKVGMTQVYDAAGNALPVTGIEAGPCNVLQIRTQERDGYSAVQLGFADKRRKKAIRSERGHVTNLSSKRSKALTAAGRTIPPKADCEPKRHIREFRGDAAGYEVGQVVTVENLAEVKAVDVVGMTKGRGYSGVMKRHNFSGQRATHGVKKVHRHQGGTGALAAWRGGGRMKKGKKMAGRYGNERVTIRNLNLVRVDKENNLLLVRGAVPGPNGGLLIVRETNHVG